MRKLNADQIATLPPGVAFWAVSDASDSLWECLDRGQMRHLLTITRGRLRVRDQVTNPAVVQRVVVHSWSSATGFQCLSEARAAAAILMALEHGVSDAALARVLRPPKEKIVVQ